MKAHLPCCWSHLLYLPDLGLHIDSNLLSLSINHNLPEIPDSMHGHGLMYSNLLLVILHRNGKI